MSEQRAEYKTGPYLLVMDRQIVSSHDTFDGAREAAERNSINGNDLVSVYQYMGTSKPKRVAEWIDG